MIVKLMSFLGMPPADNFDYWMSQSGEWVELPNERRGGTSGVQRFPGTNGGLLYRKHQINHCYRDWRHPLGAPTVLREKQALLAFEALGLHVPRIIFCGARMQEGGNWEAVLVTEDLKGFESLEALYERGEHLRWGEALSARIFQQIGEQLALLHQSRWQHGCLYPKHIFLRLDEQENVHLAFLDLEKSRQRWTIRQAARHDMLQLRRRVPWGDAEWRVLEDGYRRQMGWVIDCTASVRRAA